MNATALASCCWCDLATPPSAWTTAAGPGLALHRLVFSDEFNDPSRSFANGEDPKWTALHVADTANEGKTVYLPEQATVALDAEELGVSALRIATVYERTTGPDPSGTRQITMPFRSAMLQSWNKFCFTGGVVEFRARMPHGSGYWPALWLFGNLGRAVYQSSNTGLWPWSYDECDADLALAPDSPPQRISACDDHDLERDGLHGYQVRAVQPPRVATLYPLVSPPRVTTSCNHRVTTPTATRDAARPSSTCSRAPSPTTAPTHTWWARFSSRPASLLTSARLCLASPPPRGRAPGTVG